MRPSSAEAQRHREEALAGLVALGRELVGGSLRWLATIFTAASILLVAGMYAGIVPAETYWPVRTRGTTASVLILFVFTFWAVLAVMNWRSYARRRRHAPSTTRV
jgi:hypothetical protein